MRLPPGRRSRSTSTSRSASRSAPTATSWSTPGAAARGPNARVEAFLPALEAEVALRADALDAAFGAPGAAGRPPLQTLYLGGGTPSLMAPEAIGGLVELVGERFGLAPDAEVTLEANPGPDERGDAAAWAAAGVNRLSLRRAVDGRPRAQAHRPAPPRRRRRRRGRRGARRRHRLGQPRPPLRPARQLGGDVDDHPGRGARARAGPPLALRADARRPRRRGPDRSRRRPPPDDARRPPLAGDRPARAGRGPGGRRVPPRGRPARRRPGSTATRSATGRGRATRAGTTSPTGAGSRTRRSARARTRSTA